MIYEEDILSKQLYNLNKKYIIKIKNPMSNKHKTKIDYVYCFFWRLYRLLIKLFRRDIIDEEHYLTFEELENKDNDFEIDNIPKVAIYTCIIGGYDKLWEPLYKSKYCDYYAITDFEIDNGSAWKRIDFHEYEDKIDKKDSPAYINRWFKMHPQEVFSSYQYSIYIDGNVLVVSDLMPLVIKMINEKNFLGIHRHYARKYIESEVKAIVKFKKNINKELTYKQVSRYKACGYNNDIPMLEATILIRKHNDDKCIKVMNDWWSEFIKYSPRDQLSLPYVLWKNDVSLKDVTVLGNNEYLNPRFYINNHT